MKRHHLNFPGALDQNRGFVYYEYRNEGSWADWK